MIPVSSNRFSHQHINVHILKNCCPLQWKWLLTLVYCFYKLKGCIVIKQPMAETGYIPCFFFFWRAPPLWRVSSWLLCDWFRLPLDFKAQRQLANSGSSFFSPVWTISICCCRTSSSLFFCFLLFHLEFVAGMRGTSRSCRSLLGLTRSWVLRSSKEEVDLASWFCHCLLPWPRQLL